MKPHDEVRQNTGNSGSYCEPHAFAPEVRIVVDCLPLLINFISFSLLRPPCLCSSAFSYADRVP